MRGPFLMHGIEELRGKIMKGTRKFLEKNTYSRLNSMSMRYPMKTRDNPLLSEAVIYTLPMKHNPLKYSSNTLNDGLSGSSPRESLLSGEAALSAPYLL